MATPRGKGTDKAVSLYCQELLRRAEKEGRSGKDIAAAAGISASLISQIKSRGEGVGFRSARGLAKAFGMNLGELVDQAEAWADGGEGRPRSPELAAAMDLAEKEGIPERVMAAVIARMPGDETAAVGEPQWLSLFRAERARQVVLARLSTLISGHQRVIEAIAWNDKYERHWAELRRERLSWLW